MLFLLGFFSPSYYSKNNFNYFYSTHIQSCIRVCVSLCHTHTQMQWSIHRSTNRFSNEHPRVSCSWTRREVVFDNLWYSMACYIRRYPTPCPNFFMIATRKPKTWGYSLGVGPDHKGPIPQIRSEYIGVLIRPSFGEEILVMAEISGTVSSRSFCLEGGRRVS